MAGKLKIVVVVIVHEKQLEAIIGDLYNKIKVRTGNKI